MSDQTNSHAAHGTVSNDSEHREPWLERWWAVLVIGYVFLLAMVCLYITNVTFGH